jgi:hypothetical protein
VVAVVAPTTYQYVPARGETTAMGGDRNGHGQVKVTRPMAAGRAAIAAIAAMWQARSSCAEP